MILVVESDAFYLCEPKSRSRAGGYHYMGNRSDLDKRPDTVNGAIDCISCIIKSVVSSVAVAEYAALFLNGEIAMGLRKTLADLNYPQPATPIACDNAVDVGISKHTVRQRRTKAIAMRFDWIQDRVDDGEFTVKWFAGVPNLAD